jgi:membrane protein YqaA with SNARE-associated domain
LVRYLERLGEYLLALSIPGLFAIALLDSAAIPLVGGPDGMVMLLAWQRPDRLLWIVLAASLGSALGCLILYRIGRAGGEMVLARISPRRKKWVKHKVETNAFWAVFLGVIVPPPFPTKPIILAAGVFHTPQISFFLAALTGRTARYFAMAYMGSRFGDQAAEIIKRHYSLILLMLAGLIVLIFLMRKLLSSTHGNPPAVSP